MAATPRVAKVGATLTILANPRITRVGGTVTGTVGVKVARIGGTVAAAAKVKVASVGGAVAISAFAPTVTPPAAQNVVSSARVLLTAAATPKPPATIASVTWRLVGRDVGAKTPVFESTSGLSVAVHVPPDIIARTYTFGVTAVDSAGRSSAEGLVIVTVQKADKLIATVSGWAPMQPGYAVAGAWV